MSIEKLEAKIKTHEEAIATLKGQIRKIKADEARAEEKAVFARLKASGLSLSALDKFIEMQKAGE